MKLGTLRTSSALALCAMIATGAVTAIAADNNTVSSGLHETRTPASITLSADVNPIALDGVKKTSSYASTCKAGCACASCAGDAKHYTGMKSTGNDGIQKAFLTKGEDAGAVYLLDVRRDGTVGGLTKMKKVDQAPPAKKLMVDAKANGGGSSCIKYDVAHDGSSDKVRGTGQQYGADMAHRRGVVIASIERPDASA